MKKIAVLTAAFVAAATSFPVSAIYVEGQTPDYSDGQMHIMSETGSGGLGTTGAAEIFSAQDVCRGIGGNFIVHMATTPLGGAACLLGDREVSLESLQDKYRTYVDGMMIHYASEWKYSDPAKWDDYVEFLQSDIDDTVAFREMDISDEARVRIDEKLPIVRDIAETVRLEAALGAANAHAISDALSSYESRFSEADLPRVYTDLAVRSRARISEIEYQMMVSRYTPEGSRLVTLRLNSFKYLLLLVQGLMR